MGHESDSGSRLSLHVMYRNADLQVWESLAGGSFCAVTPAEEALADSQIRQRRAAALETQSTAEALRRWMSVVPRPENAERLRREVLQQSATTKPKPQAGPTTKYVELLVVNDWKRIMQRGGNVSQLSVVLLCLSHLCVCFFVQTLDGSNAIVNVQNALYSTVTWSTGLYKVQLIGQISFVNGDPYKVANGTCQDCTAFEVDVNELLSKFNVYRSVSPRRIVAAHAVASHRCSLGRSRTLTTRRRMTAVTYSAGSTSRRLRWATPASVSCAARRSRAALTKSRSIRPASTPPSRRTRWATTLACSTTV